MIVGYWSFLAWQIVGVTAGCLTFVLALQVDYKALVVLPIALFALGAVEVEPVEVDREED